LPPALSNGRARSAAPPLASDGHVGHMGDDAERGEKLAMFMSIAGCDDATAIQFLESCNWDLDRSINNYLAVSGDLGAMGGGDGGGGGGNAPPLEDFMEEEEVRAPIPQRVDRIVEHPRIVGSALHGAHDRGESEVRAREAFRDFEQETTVVGDGDGSDRAKKPKNLADIYRPPLELCFNGSFEELREAGRSQGKWLLVNVQSPEEFASQQLNADTWRDEALRAVIGAHFLFWQQYAESPAGSVYARFYLKTDAKLPHVGLLDPRTGQLCKSFTGFVNAERLMDLLMTYADRDLQPMPSIGAYVEATAAAAASGPAPALEARDASMPARTGATGSAPQAAAAERPPAEPAVDPAVDDAFWAQRAPGDEPAAGTGVVQLVIKLPDGSRATPRNFSVDAPLAAVLSHVHSAGFRIPSASAQAWQLLQPMPRAVLSGLETPLRSMGLTGRAMLHLQESAD